MKMDVKIKNIYELILKDVKKCYLSAMKPKKKPRMAATELSIGKNVRIVEEDFDEILAYIKQNGYKIGSFYTAAAYEKMANDKAFRNAFKKQPL